MLIKKEILKNDEFFVERKVPVPYVSMLKTFLIVQCQLFIGNGAGAGEKKNRSRSATLFLKNRNLSLKSENRSGFKLRRPLKRIRTFPLPCLKLKRKKFNRMSS